MDNLKREFNELERLSESFAASLEKRDIMVDKRLRKANKRFTKSLEQEKRLQKIIEICFLNKDLNEDWERVIKSSN